MKSAARRQNALVGFGHLLRLVVWIGPYCVAVFAAVAAGALARWLWRFSDWIYDRADLWEASRWKESL